jgi:hypothetical protein
LGVDRAPPRILDREHRDPILVEDLSTVLALLDVRRANLTAHRDSAGDHLTRIRE